MLNTLIKYAINRGALTSACALINLVLVSPCLNAILLSLLSLYKFVSVPGTFWFFIGLVLSSKCALSCSMITSDVLLFTFVSVSALKCVFRSYPLITLSQIYEQHASHVSRRF
jgi:hypothetical protein